MNAPGGRASVPRRLSLILYSNNVSKKMIRPNFPNVERVEYYGNRSHQAYHYSVARLVAYAKVNNQKLYGWTFTFTEKMPQHMYRGYWQGFIRDFGNHWRNEGRMPLAGVKVTQLHKLGGIHYHAILNQRIPVGMVRRLGRKWKIGIIHAVKLGSITGARKYFGRYIGREVGGQKLARNQSSWECMFGFAGCRVNDIKRETAYTFACRLVKQLMGRKLTYLELRQICESQNVHDLQHMAAAAYLSAERGDCVPFTWSWHMLENEAGIKGDEMDGRVPF